MVRRRAVTFGTARGEDRWRLDVLTMDEVMALPPSTELVYAARALGLGRTAAQQMARQHGELEYGPERVPVLMVGKIWRVRRADLLRALGITDPAQQPSPDPVTR